MFALVKDHQGFLWAATTEVLQRFDGVRFQHASSFAEPGDPVPIGVRFITLAPDSTIWFSSEIDGITRFDPRSGRFNRLSQLARDTMPALQGTCGPVTWATPDSAYIPYGRSGIVLWLPQQRRLVVQCRFEGSRDVLPKDMLLDPSRRYFWIAAHDGLLRWRRDSGSYEHIPFPQMLYGPNGKLRAVDLLPDKDGAFWMTTWGNGLVHFDPATERSYAVLADSIDPQPIENIFRGLVRTANGHLIAGAQEGLLDHDPATGRTVLIRHDPSDEHSLLVGEVLSLLHDKQGVLWIGTVHGVCRADPAQNAFSVRHVRNTIYTKAPWPFLNGVAEWKDRLLMVTSNGDGLLRFDPATGNIERFPFMELGRDGRPVELVDIVALKNGSMLVFGVHQGPFLLDPESMRMSLYDSDVGFPERLHGLGHALDAQGGIWTSSPYKGAMRFDPQNRSVTYFTERSSPATALRDQHWVQGIAPAPDGAVWLTEYTAGIARWDPASSTLTHFDKDDLGASQAQAIWDIALDKLGRLWLGTRGAGAIVLPANTPTVANARSLNGHQGLPSLVSSVVPDPAGEHMWLAGPMGLYRVDVHDLSVERFGPEEGLAGFDVHHADLRFHPSGRTTITDFAKVVQFDRTKLGREPTTPFMHINTVQLLGVAVPRQRWMNALVVPHDSDLVSIAYTAVAIGHRQDLRTEYLLEGSEGPWQQAGAEGIAVFRRLSPGRWTFRLRAVGVPASEQRIAFTVEPAWWESWWARVLGVCGLGAIVVLSYRERLRRVRREERLQGEFERQLAEVEMSALRAQMNPHFLFNSLNSINRYIIKNEPKLASEYLTKFSRLMRLVLNNSKQQVVPLKDELDALNLYIELEALRFNNRFELQSNLELDQDAATVMVPPMLLQPYVENAIWHGLMHKKDGIPKLKLNVLKRNGTLRFEVEDNGVGREQSALLRSKRATDQPSQGTRITRERLELVERLHGLRTEVFYTDLKDLGQRPAGTRVTITITHED